MLNVSLKRKLLFSVGMALICITLLLSFFSYRSLREQVIDRNYNSIAYLSERSASAIAEWLDDKKSVISTLSKLDEYQDTKSLLLAQESAGFGSVYFASTDGHMQDGEESDYANYRPQEQIWYKTAQAHSGITLTPAYRDTTYTPPQNIISIVLARTNGVVGGDISTQRLQQMLDAIKLPADGFSVLIDGQGNIIASKDQALVLQPISSLLGTIDLSRLNSDARQVTPDEIQHQGHAQLLWSRAIPHSDWLLLSVVDKTTLFAPLKQQLLHQALLSSAVLLGSLLLIGALIGTLVRPLRRVSSTLALISDGEGDLTQRITITTQDEIGLLATNFNKFMNTLHQLIQQIRHEAHAMSDSARQGLLQAQNSHQQVTQQDQEIAQVATAVTEMASATQEIARHAEQTATAAQDSSQNTQEGARLVEQTRQSITALAGEISQASEVITVLDQHAQSISSVITTIQAVAEQTNLLALNAAIEAARAGEHGRGFAVVADEVRVLSHKTQSSTAEIQKTISTLQASTASAVTIMQQSQAHALHSVEDADAAAHALAEITASIQVISDMSTQIATAAEEQNKVTDEITRNIHEIKALANQLTTDADMSAQQAQQQEILANNLNQQVARFKL